MDFIIGIVLIWIAVKLWRIAKKLERVVEVMTSIDPDDLDATFRALDEIDPPAKSAPH